MTEGPNTRNGGGTSQQVSAVPAAAAGRAYDPHRRVPRGHHRVTRKGTERFEVGLEDVGGGSATVRRLEQEDEDRRIVREIPPHWSTFYAERTDG